MIGIIIELIISWLLLRFIVRKNLSALGLQPSKSRLIQWSIGFFLAAVSCSLYHLMTTVFIPNRWSINQQLTSNIVLTGFWWVLKSVLFEELLFRGALLYIAIEKWSTKKACTISAVAFGVYHWFSYNAFSNPFQMGIIFVMTGIFGWMLAYAFAKTKSMYLPIGLHLGWNLFNIIIFSNGPLGKQFFVKANESHLEGIPSLLVFLFQILALPLIMYGYFRFYKTENKQ
ncbi:CPBP family intramembrane metalloprotease [Elizabethkingia meningoseptica]|uniref:CPBP family intramembrane glutamic endopeptidase n=1 Tax=Elizabethkingia meningoseptica TaxID=238 RepID=UPI0023AF1ED2|nr:CPBP family intramembrane glutamic endopeptidase [Elizabethkingia meningoseptica]MDE5439481.1 CPBP family intramembrane metalloprotease [Elizabethkingia meningoseptica]MDE5510150.1 CPBP family intramembrane metalloprotease [Elizabethkingia meningoseptica]MDE5517325.1 CPBP family intramembrane metalloprotease [Elizabethkingia meningoseptica]MDE5527993.1 CPBP family intramembrane metalloprotease [Elizabethkingia meningoseptica]MDE5531469.1 CPBP family intramembrane metalloprotease [Elizabethk